MHPCDPYAPTHPVHPTQHPDWPSSGSSEASKRAIEASRVGGAPASPTGARQFECVVASERPRVHLRLNYARPSVRLHFSVTLCFLAKLCDLRFLGRPANECQCACVHLSHERVGPVTQRRPQQHTRTQSHEQARAHLLLQQRTLHDCTPRKTGRVAWKRGLAR